MNLLKSLFPISRGATSVKGLIIAILIYFVVNFVGGLVFSFLSVFPLVGFVFDFIAWVLHAYCLVGVIVAVLILCEVIE